MQSSVKGQLALRYHRCLGIWSEQQNSLIHVRHAPSGPRLWRIVFTRDTFIGLSFGVSSKLTSSSFRQADIPISWFTAITLLSIWRPNDNTLHIPSADASLGWHFTSIHCRGTLLLHLNLRDKYWHIVILREGLISSGVLFLCHFCTLHTWSHTPLYISWSNWIRCTLHTHSPCYLRRQKLINSALINSC